MTYCIYHIPGKKIGVTNNLEERVTRQQGYTENEYEISIKDKDLIVLNKLFSTFGTSIPEKGAISKLLGGRTGPDSIFVKSLIYDANNNKINMIIEWSGRDSLFELEEKPIHSGQKKKGKKSNKKTKGHKSRDRKKKTIRR